MTFSPPGLCCSLPGLPQSTIHCRIVFCLSIIDSHTVFLYYFTINQIAGIATVPLLWFAAFLFCESSLKMIQSWSMDPSRKYTYTTSCWIPYWIQVHNICSITKLWKLVKSFYSMLIHHFRYNRLRNTKTRWLVVGINVILGRCWFSLSSPNCRTNNILLNYTHW